MNATATIRFASATWDHRLEVGEGQIMRVDVKTGLCTPQPPLCTHTPSCPSGAIPARKRTADLIRTASITAATNRLHSNPHSLRPPLASYQAARGFLPRGLSDAYRRPH